MFEGQLCFKSEYHTGGDIDVYNSAGENFMPRDVEVQPVIPDWKEADNG